MTGPSPRDTSLFDAGARWATEPTDRRGYGDALRDAVARATTPGDDRGRELAHLARRVESLLGNLDSADAHEDAEAVADRLRALAASPPAPEGEAEAGSGMPRPDFDIDCDAVPSLGIPEGIAHGWEFKSSAFYPSDSVQAFAGVLLLVSSDGTQEFKVDEPEIVALEQDAERVLAAIAQVRAWDDPQPAPAGPEAEGAGETADGKQ